MLTVSGMGQLFEQPDMGGEGQLCGFVSETGRDGTNSQPMTRHPKEPMGESWEDFDAETQNRLVPCISRVSAKRLCESYNEATNWDYKWLALRIIKTDGTTRMFNI